MLEPSSRAVWVVAAVGIGSIAMHLIGKQRVHDHFKLKSMSGKLKMYFEADSGDMKGIICHRKDCKTVLAVVEKGQQIPGAVVS